ncbi:hypothetical protein ABBQ32_010256 [Trebouxia sp. C0010 RCD-2024]
MQRTGHPSVHNGPRRVTLCKCSNRQIHVGHRAPWRAQSRSRKRLWQAERQRHRSGFRSKTGRNLCYSVTAAGSAGSNRDGSGATVQELDRRRFLLRHVQDAEPGIMQEFVDLGPPHVVDAMRQTIANYLGGLPPPFFTVEISAKGEDLAQLMYTMMVTGYVFRNVQYKLDLRTNMLPQGNETFDEYDFPPALPIMGMLDYSQDGQYAPGIQAKVTGEVLRWHHVNGVQAIPAKEYIEKLERENQILKQQVSTQLYVHAAGNLLLNYLKGLEADAVKSLAIVSEDGVEAMNTFIHRLLGTEALTGEDMGVENKSDHVELARCMFWLMIVGYNLRTLENRFDIEQSMMLPPCS